MILISYISYVCFFFFVLLIAQVHDVLMKMILTGMLIYVPSTSRAGIATLVCVIACCNLNYFRPPKNNILFWLTQISFITTTAKYVVALLLSVDTASQSMEEQTTISRLLITLDVFFMSSSLIAICIAVLILRAGIKKIQKSNNVVASNDTLTQIVPIAAADNDGDYRFSVDNDINSDNGNDDASGTGGTEPEASQRPHRIRSLAFTPAQHLGHFGAEHSEAQNIHDSFHIHEEGLRNRTEQRQKRA